MQDGIEFSDEAGTARDVAKIFEEYHKAEVVEFDGPNKTPGMVMLVPKGLEPISLRKFADEYRGHPERREGTAKLRELDSFVGHVKRFADASSAIFANPDPTAPSLVAVLDYHLIGADGQPRFGRHRSLYAPPVSEEWKAWLNAQGSQMGQMEFAQFLEDRISDVIAPDQADASIQQFAELVGGSFASPTKLLELSRGLQVSSEERVKNAINLSSGEIQVHYDQIHTDGRGEPIRVPNLFLIAIPVFRAGAPYRIPVRLRYRVRDGKLSWSFSLYRADKTFDHAFEEIRAKAASETGLPVYVGAPEA